jgi:hypothetical protein
MKTALLIAGALCGLAISSIAEDLISLPLPYHPRRQIGDKVYSLQPVYDWIKSEQNKTVERPMKEWIGYRTRNDFGLDYRVEQVVPEGLILRSSGERWFGPNGFSEERNYESHQAILLLNYPGATNLIDHQHIQFLAIRAGNFKYTGTDGAEHAIAAYDYGKPPVTPVPPPLTPEQIKAAQEAANARAIANKKKAEQGQVNAVRWLQPQATNGDAAAQCRLGLHYLNGQGCETNREQAIYWLKKAADQGDAEASTALTRLQK